jgi:hypothetical protein
MYNEYLERREEKAFKKHITNEVMLYKRIKKLRKSQDEVLEYMYS